MRNRKGISILVLALAALMLVLADFYKAKLVDTGSTRIWGGFWAATVLIGVWLVFSILVVLRKRP